MHCRRNFSPVERTSAMDCSEIRPPRRAACWPRQVIMPALLLHSAVATSGRQDQVDHDARFKDPSAAPGYLQIPHASRSGIADGGPVGAGKTHESRARQQS